jgi:CheY-like chemotaxis protein
MMRVMLIDDDTDVLNIINLRLQCLGHSVAAFSDSRQALTTLQRGTTDLVISDIKMPFADGFCVARHVAETLGTSPPRLLLISGTPDDRRLQEFPPSMIIGVLPKPFSHADLTQVLAMLEPTRSRCPGTLAGFCAFADKVGKPGVFGESAGCAGVCGSTNYAECPHYDQHCGLALRNWVYSAGAATVPNTP